MTTADRIRSAGEALIRLVDTLAHAEEVQYLRPVGPSTREDTPERAQGGVSRPTEDIALDERRLRVRAGVISAELLLDELAQSANASADELTAALLDWAGPRA